MINDRNLLNNTILDISFNDKNVIKKRGNLTEVEK